MNISKELTSIIGTSSQQSELLQHLYGLINGLYAATTLYLVLASLSYLKKNNTKGISKAFFLTCIAFVLFSFYSFYFQQYTQAVSTKIIPAFVFEIAKYATPIALAIVTHVFLVYCAIMSFSAYETRERYKGLIYGLYAFDAICLIALCFIDSQRIISTLITAAFVPHALLAALYTFSSLTRLSLRGFFSFMLLACAIHSAILATAIYMDSFSPSAFSMAFINLLFACTAIIFSFLAIRYGYDEAELYFQLNNVDHHNLIHGVHKALKNNDFYLVYQPQIDLKTQKLCGLEALIRWKHPQLGPTLPDDFIPLAEKADLIDGVCRWVIDAAVEQCSQLHRQGLSELRISINFSAKNVTPDIVHYLKRVLEKHNVPASHLGVEITESLMVHESAESQQALDMLHKLGTPLSLDDYGTGFSSLSYINKLALHEIKIDRSFVTDIESNQDNYVISHSTIRLGQTLGLTIMAEGVETAGALKKLSTMGCDKAQGYFIGRPMNSEQLQQWLKNSPYTSIE